jgi:Sulfotransferase domain
MPLEVICAGMGRTGTTSLKLALEELGFGPCHHMIELIADPSSWAFWTRAYAGERIDWEEGFKGYRSCADDPSTPFYAEIAEYYPRAKVILTERDPERWWQSAKSTALSEGQAALLENGPPAMQPIADMVTAMGWDPRLPGKRDREQVIAWFQRHNEEVRRKIAPERLLVYQVSQGWGALCRFLDVPVPNTPFPHVNRTDDYLKMLRGGPQPAKASGRGA